MQLYSTQHIYRQLLHTYACYIHNALATPVTLCQGWQSGSNIHTHATYAYSLSGVAARLQHTHACLRVIRGVASNIRNMAFTYGSSLVQ